MRTAFALALIASAAIGAGRVYDRGQAIVSRRSDRGQMNTGTLPTGTADSIAAANGVVCGCAQISGATGIILDERGIESISGDVSPINAYCTKTSLTANIKVGDLVPCAANIPRVRPTNADGSGALKVFTEGKRWNETLYSSDFSQAAWNPTGVVSAAPTVYADVLYAPDGTLTADMVCFEATAAATGLSELFAKKQAQGSGCSIDGGGNISASVYATVVNLDGGLGTGTIDVATYNGSAWEPSNCAVVEYVSDGGNLLGDGGMGGWTRCLHENFVQDSSAVGYFLIGNASLVNIGSVARPKQCIGLAKAQCEKGATATSPIDTGGTRPTLAYPDVVSVQNQSPLAASLRTGWVGDSLSGLFTVGTAYQELTTRTPAVYATATGRTVDNWGHSGDKLADAELQWTNYGVRSRAQRIVIFVGINDIIGDSANGHTLWTSEQTWIQARAAEGIFVTAVGLSPCSDYSGWTAAKQTQIGNFNTDGAAYCGANPSVCKFVNIYPTLVATDGGALAAANAAPDGLHYNQVGETLCGNTIAAASP